MKALKVGDVVAIKRRYRWWGEVVLLPAKGCPTYGVSFELLGRPERWQCEYPRSALEPVGVNVR